MLIQNSGATIDLKALAQMIDASKAARQVNKKPNMFTFNYAIGSTRNGKTGLNEDDIAKALSDLLIYGDYCIVGDLEDKHKRTYVPFDQWPDGLLRSRQIKLDEKNPPLPVAPVAPVALVDAVIPVQSRPVLSLPEPKISKPLSMKERILEFITANNESGCTFSMLVSARGITSGVSFHSAMKNLEDTKKIEWVGDPLNLRKSKRWYLTR